MDQFQFMEACKNGNLTIVESMISKGASNWNTGLYYACYGGHMNIVELMISKGANNLNSGLYCACQGGHLNMVELMISKGAEYNFDHKKYNKYLLNKTVTKKYILTLNMPLDILRIIVAYL